MIKLASRRPTTIGAMLLVFGLTSKTMELPIPEWMTCVSISAGLIAVIFAGGSHSSASARRYGGPSLDNGGLRKV